MTLDRGVSYVFACIVLAGFVWLNVYMFINFVSVEKPTGHWDWALLLYNALASIAYAAAGALLGVQVQAGAVASAKTDKAAAETKARRMQRATVDALREYQNTAVMAGARGFTFASPEAATAHNKVLDGLMAILERAAE